MATKRKGKGPSGKVKQREVIHFVRAYQDDVGTWCYKVDCTSKLEIGRVSFAHDPDLDLVNCPECLRRRLWDLPIADFLGDRLLWGDDDDDNQEVLL